jgi:hypothetical protein
MKKLNVLQYALVITGIIIGYQAFQTLLVAIWGLVQWVFDGGNGASPFFPRIADYVFLCCRVLACWFLTFGSAKTTAFIAEKSKIANDLRLKAQPAALLYIVLVALGVYFLVLNLPRMLVDLINGIKESSADNIAIENRITYFTSPFANIIQTILAILLLILARPLSNFFVQKLQNEQVLLEDEIEELLPPNHVIKPE